MSNEHITTINCVKMLNLLQSNFYGAKHLAEVLGVSIRSVRYYRKTLLSAGVDVRTIRGPKGGYYIPWKIVRCPRCGEEHESS